jgi:hypothetical protein
VAPVAVVAEPSDTAVLDRAFERLLEDTLTTVASCQDEGVPRFSLIGEPDGTEDILSSDWRDDTLLLLLPVGLLALSHLDDETRRTHHRDAQTKRREGRGMRASIP